MVGWNFGYFDEGIGVGRWHTQNRCGIVLDFELRVFCLQFQILQFLYSCICRS